MRAMKAMLAFFALLLVSATMGRAADVAKISSVEAARRVASGQAILIDVREPDEWAESGVAEPAMLLPMSDFNGEQKLWKPFLAQNAGKELVLYCRSGNRSGKVAAKLAAQGKRVANAGAFRDWEEAGLPVRKVEK